MRYRCVSITSAHLQWTIKRENHTRSSVASYPGQQSIAIKSRETLPDKVDSERPCLDKVGGDRPFLDKVGRERPRLDMAGIEF